MTIDLPFGIARDTRYEELCRGFRWDIPDQFNFARDVVDAWADHRDGPALISVDADCRERTMRFSDVSVASKRLANVLRDRGVGMGNRIIVVMPQIAEWQIAMVAAMRIGAVAIPCIEMLTASDLAYRIQNSGAKAVFCRASECAKIDEAVTLSEQQVRLRIALDGKGIQATFEADGWIDYASSTAAAGDNCEAAAVGAEEPAVMYYTSGSTGHPKGVLHASRAIFGWRYAALHWLDLSPQDRIWCTADTGWSKAGTSVLFGPWSCGACAFMYDGPFKPADRLALLERHKVTVYCAPATELNRVVDENVADFDLSALRRTVSAGEPMSPVVAERWQAATGVGVSEAYGQTEALMMVFNYPSERVKIGSMGRPGPGFDLDIVDDDGNRLGTDEEGHIAVLQPNPLMMLGYWGHPERTAECFVEGPEGRWYLSGDRGTRDDDGYFWFAGRADDVITSAGYRIGPMEVENVLLQHEAVAECAVVGSPDPQRGEIVKAFIMLRDGFTGDETLVKSLQEFTKSKTAPYKYPREIAFLDTMPMTLTGKIRRRDLRDRERAAKLQR